ncbi:MAG: aldose 1-epimerase [Deinococcus sp.]|nr:aldose 1-epimerase [Deinococcus sp.]
MRAAWRNYGCRIQDNLTIYGMRALVMENQLLRITMLVDKGSDIIEFLHKPTDTDFMWHSPIGLRNPHRMVPSGPRSDGAFLDYYQGGWQEILPSGGPTSRSHGAEFGLHGEVCLIPWDSEVVADSPEEIAVRLAVRTYRTPFYLEKTLTLTADSPVLTMAERVVNEGAEELPLMWGHHPTFGPPFLDQACVIDLPVAPVEAHSHPISSTSRLAPGAVGKWPKVKGLEGAVDLSRVPANIGHSDLAYVTNVKAGWAALTSTKRRLGFGMTWDPKVFRHVWLWMVYGGNYGHPWYGRTYNLAIEPWTSYPAGGIAEAIKNGTALVLGAGQEVSTTFRALVYSGVRRVKEITPEGEVRSA